MHKNTAWRTGLRGSRDGICQAASDAEKARDDRPGRRQSVLILGLVLDGTQGA
jgi:hypothetical protein